MYIQGITEITNRNKLMLLKRMIKVVKIIWSLNSFKEFTHVNKFPKIIFIKKLLRSKLI